MEASPTVAGGYQKPSEQREFARFAYLQDAAGCSAAAQRAVLRELGEWWPTCWSTIEDIAQLTCLSVSSVGRALRVLEQRGLITKVGTKRGEHNRPYQCEYAILEPPLRVGHHDRFPGSVTMTDPLRSSSSSGLTGQIVHLHTNTPPTTSTGSVTMTDPEETGWWFEAGDPVPAADIAYAEKEIADRIADLKARGFRGLRSERDGMCPECDEPFSVGDRIFWQPDTSETVHLACYSFAEQIGGGMNVQRHKPTQMELDRYWSCAICGEEARENVVEMPDGRNAHRLCNHKVLLANHHVAATLSSIAGCPSLEMLKSGAADLKRKLGGILPEVFTDALTARRLELENDDQS
jgi:hypothetical protein